ncbi:porin OmpA [Utexia brackfieldae]|uniref:porin OmpA n=1 Tax=Utexia brackfieldae TaxID=3074108 RepID=UPI00370D8789
MKKTTLALAVAIASLSTAAIAAQPSNTFYAGGKVGWTSFHNASLGDDFDKSSNGVGGGLFLGYQANPYMAIELGYDYLGRAKYNSNSADLENSKFTVHGASLTGKLSYPLSFITDDLDFYVRAGGFIHHTKFKGNGYDNGDVSISPVYAGGFDYKLTDNLSARIDYQWVNNIGNDGPAGYRPDNALLALGVSYNLGGPTAKPQPVALALQENRFVLNEDVLFDYAKATLKPEGQTALDGLLKALVKINPTDGAIVVIGHTDPIGSANYNLKLSQERAQAVVDYLVAKGVPANVITARGVGKSEPLTGDKCNNLRGAELRACYAPDRRVEIEVKATNVKEVVIEKTAQGKIIDKTLPEVEVNNLK